MDIYFFLRFCVLLQKIDFQNVYQRRFEKNQPFGKKAKQLASVFCFEKTVVVIVNDQRQRKEDGSAKFSLRTRI